MRTPRVVTIDGAAGSGKSTLARGLASALGLAYVNTGLMYRALTLAAVDRKVDVDDGASLATLLASLRFSLDAGEPPQVRVEGGPSGPRLAGAEVEARVSAVARHPEVRAPMRAEQRRLGENGAVMEGRDMGSMVFVDAPVKLYLEADPAVRAARRSRDRAEGGVATALHARDRSDMRVTPFEPAEGAVVIDTTRMQIGEVLREALAIVRARAPELTA